MGSHSEGGLGEREAPHDARWMPWSNGPELEGIRLGEGASASFWPPGGSSAVALSPEYMEGNWMN